jgi:hypothetical protein
VAVSAAGFVGMEDAMKKKLLHVITAFLFGGAVAAGLAVYAFVYIFWPSR